MSTPLQRIRVLVVDDSALARRAIQDALTRDPALEVVGVAADAYEARDKILALAPDVVTLDIQMPLMDGLTFLRILQEHHPVPVVVVSSLTPAGSELAVAALEAGAVDVIQKPEGRQSAARMAVRLCAQVRAAAGARRLHRSPAPASAAVAVPALSPLGPAADPRRLVLIGASTGGVEALRTVLPRLPTDMPPVVVVQHIPAYFSRVMAEHLDRVSALEVREAVDGEELHSGLCLIAPGDFHVAVKCTAGRYRVRLSQTPPVNHCRPSVDVLFRSAAEQAGARAVGVLLTGMGSDGARGMQMLHAAGARTIAESEQSCVVFGMPQAAIATGSVERIEPLTRIPEAILEVLRQ
jgi:two-component system chemotaxis response regulator CheB